ncbi:MAG: T9SS type A sorting domain-containing protein [Flavobacteriales bacterium]
MLSTTMNNRWLGVGLGLVSGCLLSIAALRCEAQGNLVPNPSFEQLDTCPYTTGFQEGDRPLDWEKWNESPDYFNECSQLVNGTDTLLDVPQNGFGFQPAYHGGAYVGVYTYGSTGQGISYREIVGCQLAEPLEVGELYDLSFYSSPAMGAMNYWPMTWVCNNIGMLFCMQPNVWTGLSGPEFLIRNYAHLYDAGIQSDTTNWTFVSGSFVADSAYQYVALGNFFSNDNTDTLHLVPGGSLGAYYYIDGVCVTRAGEPCEIMSGIEEGEAMNAQVFPNPARVQITVRLRPGTKWQVFDAIGRLMAAGQNKGSELTIPVAQWAPGEYVLRLQAERRTQIRFVVMQ